MVIIIGGVGSSSESATVDNSDTPKTEQSSDKQETVKEPEMAVTVSEIYSDYSENELAADDKYKDKYITVTGNFDRTSDVLNSKQLYINDGQQYSLNSVYMPLKEGTESYEVAKSLQTGDAVSITGTIAGFDGLTVGFKNDATLVKE